MLASELKELLAFFDTSSIRELDLSLKEVQLYVSKQEMSRHERPTSQVFKSEEVVERTDPSELENRDQQKEDKISLEAKHLVEAPLVGVVYEASEPGSAPFKSIGDRVEVGETLCIIEAMKIMNEIKSEVSGEIVAICFENEAVVEYGAPLFKIN
ncbi:acetyl-CoA carboxylase biotin carboxyl carrier protein [Vagococcus sp.]|uniref:acetyl-CoA carboxylase biotin carboxyl carrier protein n=1 Tax=Vagococcus sp. TaxID=1933889 RepID=UPI003F9BA19F